MLFKMVKRLRMMRALSYEMKHESCSGGNELFCFVIVEQRTQKVVPLFKAISLLKQLDALFLKSMAHFITHVLEKLSRTKGCFVCVGGIQPASLHHLPFRLQFLSKAPGSKLSWKREGADDRYRGVKNQLTSHPEQQQLYTLFTEGSPQRIHSFWSDLSNTIQNLPISDPETDHFSVLTDGVGFWWKNTV